MTTPRRQVLLHAVLAENVSEPINYNSALGCRSKFCVSAEKFKLEHIIPKLARPNPTGNHLKDISMADYTRSAEKVNCVILVRKVPKIDKFRKAVSTEVFNGNIL